VGQGERGDAASAPRQPEPDAGQRQQAGQEELRDEGVEVRRAELGRDLGDEVVLEVAEDVERQVEAPGRGQRGGEGGGQRQRQVAGIGLGATGGDEPGDDRAAPRTRLPAALG